MRTLYNKTRRFALLLAIPATLFSCNSFLDELPDNRTEIDTEDKVSMVLVSAYSSTLPALMQELMSDNITDSGKSYSTYLDILQESYLFKTVTSTSNDSPEAIWEDNYSAIAAANSALEAIDELGGGEELDAQRGEALLCRAYAHFTLCNTFCQAYNPESSTTDLGIPYVTKVEDTVFGEYERGTVADVYAKIAQDIEAGIGLIDDSSYSKPKYHFNAKAANAFAAQFYLYYGKYDKAVSYATAAIGENPTSLFRDWTLFTGTSSTEYTNAYVASDEAANFFIQGARSYLGRFRLYRYITDFQLLAEINRSQGPWGTTLTNYNTIYAYSSRSYFFPKNNEYFTYTDVAQGIGYCYVVLVPYTTEKTILDRAEAHVLLQEYDAAATDLNYFYRQGGANTSLTAQQIADFYTSSTGATYCRDLAPRFTLVDDGLQIPLLQACLHARRIAAAQEGTRLQDLKRYGIAYTHVCDGATNIEIEPYDKRLAIQIPGNVASAGMTENPR